MIPLRDSEHSNRFPFVTTTLIILNSLVFLHEMGSANLEGFIFAWGFVPANFSFLNPNSWLTLLTSPFLHGGLLHILSNMWFLWVFGDNVEEYLGKFRFVCFYLVGGVIAGLTQFLVAPHSPVPMIGASGAVAAVLGAYLKLFPHAKIDAILPIGFILSRVRIGAPLMLGWWFITQLFNGVASLTVPTMGGGVAFFAHVGGFLYGYWLANRIAPPQAL